MEGGEGWPLKQQAKGWVVHPLSELGSTSEMQLGNLTAFLSSFHIGSSCTDPQIFTQSIADARLVFEMGAELGHKMRLLDLGGGIPGAKESKGHFEEVWILLLLSPLVECQLGREIRGGVLRGVTDDRYPCATTVRTTEGPPAS